MFPLFIILATLFLGFFIAFLLGRKQSSFSIRSFLSFIFGLSAVGVFLFWTIFQEYQTAEQWGVLEPIALFLGFYGMIAPFLAIPFGIAGIRDIKKKRLRGIWFAIVGIVLGAFPFVFYLMLAVGVLQGTY